MNVLMLLKPKETVKYIYDSNTLRQGMEKMRAHSYTAIPVISESGRYVGTVSEGDFLYYILDKRDYGADGSSANHGGEWGNEKYRSRFAYRADVHRSYGTYRTGGGSPCARMPVCPGGGDCTRGDSRAEMGLPP